MQIKTVHQLQNILDKTTKVVKFAWRHFFVLNLFHCLFIAFVEAPTVNWGVFATYLFIAIFLDWLKTKIKLRNAGNFIHRTPNQIASLTDQNSWNYGIAETTSYLSRDMDPTSYGSTAWHSNSFNVGSSAYYNRISRDYDYNRVFNNH